MCIVGTSESLAGTMTFGGDSRVTAAKELLRTRLEEVFLQTSDDCRAKLWECETPVGTTDEGDPIIRSAIRQWREESLRCVTSGYESLIMLIRQVQRDAATSADIARELAWQAVDEAFGWTGADKSGSTRFKEWCRVTSIEGYAVPGLRMISPECNSLAGPLFEQLNCDFRLLFERRLNDLRLEAISNAPAGQSTRQADSSDSNANGMQSGFAHSDDYRSVTVSGKQYNLTQNQALIIQTLYDAHIKGFPVGTATLLKSITAPNSRIRDSFRSGDGAELWNRFVVQVRKGMYGLKLAPRR